MDVKERLHTLQATLEQRGVYDVKFCFRLGALTTLPSSKVAESVADFLEAYVENKCTKVEKLALSQVI